MIFLCLCTVIIYQFVLLSFKLRKKRIFKSLHAQKKYLFFKNKDFTDLVWNQRGWGAVIRVYRLNDRYFFNHSSCQRHLHMELLLEQEAAQPGRCFHRVLSPAVLGCLFADWNSKGFGMWAIRRSELLCAAHHKSLFCFLEGSWRTEREHFVTGIYTDVFPARHSVLAVQRKICAWVFSRKQQPKILSVSFSWKVVPGAVPLENLKSGFICMCEIRFWMYAWKIYTDRTYSTECRSYCWPHCAANTKRVAEIFFCVHLKQTTHYKEKDIWLGKSGHLVL